jgi:hypothetical protein
MIYIVSGHPRSGTSMMMEALSAGGLSVAFDPKRDEFVAECADELYKPNPHGLFEIDHNEYVNPGFPLKYAGNLIKVFYGGLRNLARHQYKVVFMLRDPEEIRQSFEAMYYKVAERRFNINNYESEMSSAIAYLKSRDDVDVIPLRYEQVVNSPKATFGQLKTNGWPIDIDKASKIVDPNLYRFRRELLTVGV